MINLYSSDNNIVINNSQLYVQIVLDLIADVSSIIYVSLALRRSNFLINYREIQLLIVNSIIYVNKPTRPNISEASRS